MSDKKTIVIIDDHPLFREGLKSMISRDPHFEVVGEAGTGREGIRVASEIKPDLVIVDISLPDKSGIQVTREIRGILPKVRVMVISMHSKIDYVTESLKGGASGYLIKETASDMLIQGLQKVAKGEYFLDNSLSHEIVSNLIGFSAKEQSMSDIAYRDLTSREQEVMRLLVEGFTSKEISDKLCISPKTVENHRTNIMNKLGIHRTVELIRYAARLGLIDVDSWKE
jgi:DNA-binding NarL/FixJ family response regulator